MVDAAPSSSSSSLFVICGLGSVGQNCVRVLKEYGAEVNALDRVCPDDWELTELPNAIATLVTGDCRKPEVLEQVGVQWCRAVLLVTDDERVNTEAAFAARLLNPTARLVVRSAKHNLNHFLAKSLGNFIAFEPTDLSASAFAFAALGSEIPGYFKLDHQLLRVVNYTIQSQDRWCDRTAVRSVNTSFRRVLCHARGDLRLEQFFEWESNEVLRAGDTLVYVELTDRVLPSSQVAVDWATRRSLTNERSPNRPLQIWQQLWRTLKYERLKYQLQRFWRATGEYRARRVALICGLLTLLLFSLGTLLLQLEYPHVSWREALSTSFSLLLGGYSDVFGGLSTDNSNTNWRSHVLGMVLTLAGTAFIGVLYALLTEALLTSKFQFFKNRPPLPTQNHIVVIGLTKLGQRIVELLQDLKQPVVGISSVAIAPNVLPQLPVVVGNIDDAITQVHLDQAKTTLIILDDDLENLEIGLMVHATHPASAIVLRTQDQLFSDNVSRLFPYAQVLCAPAVAAEVFAAAAFGENVLSLFHLSHQTILVTEYAVSEGDTLNSLLIAEIAYGYGVVPMLHQSQLHSIANFLPSDDVRLEVGDRLIVLATSESLQRIERHELAPKQWQVHVEKALTRDAVFEGANEISRITGYHLSASRQLMASLPTALPLNLYKHQAQRLVRNLSKVQVIAHLMLVTS